MNFAKVFHSMGPKKFNDTVRNWCIAREVMDELHLWGSGGRSLRIEYKLLWQDETINDRPLRFLNFSQKAVPNSQAVGQSRPESLVDPECPVYAQADDRVGRHGHARKQRNPVDVRT